MEVTEKKISPEAFEELSRKWSIPIIKDMFMGCKRFSDFVEVHKKGSINDWIDEDDDKDTNNLSRKIFTIKSKKKGLSNRVLSDQLKRLEQFGFIKKEIVNVSPIRIEYSLTQMSLDLNKILYEKIMWNIKYGLASRDDEYFRGHDIEKLFLISE